MVPASSSIRAFEDAQALRTRIHGHGIERIDGNDVGAQIGDAVVCHGPSHAAICRLVNTAAESGSVNGVRIQRIHGQSSDPKEHAK